MLVRTQQVIELDTIPASVRERIKAQVLHGEDIPSRVEVFEKHLQGREAFVNHLPPLDRDFRYRELSTSGMGHLFCLKKPKAPAPKESAKSFATEAASHVILV